MLHHTKLSLLIVVCPGYCTVIKEYYWVNKTTAGWLALSRLAARVRCPSSATVVNVLSWYSSIECTVLSLIWQVPVSIPDHNPIWWSFFLKNIIQTDDWIVSDLSAMLFPYTQQLWKKEALLEEQGTYTKSIDISVYTWGQLWIYQYGKAGRHPSIIVFLSHLAWNNKNHIMDTTGNCSANNAYHSLFLIRNIQLFKDVEKLTI